MTKTQVMKIEATDTALDKHLPAYLDLLQTVKTRGAVAPMSAPWSAFSDF